MKPVSLDMLGMIAEMGLRRIRLVMRSCSRSGLIVTPSELNQLGYALKLHARMLEGDYRMNRGEVKKFLDVCNLAVRLHDKARALQEGSTIPEKPWTDFNLGNPFVKQLLPKGSYGRMAKHLFTRDQ
jgi:hypothetical protein